MNTRRVATLFLCGLSMGVGAVAARAEVFGQATGEAAPRRCEDTILRGTGFETQATWAGSEGSGSSLALDPIAAVLPPEVIVGAKVSGTGHSIAPVFTADRARVLLRSLTVPGWGQASAGRKTSAALFAVAEASVWGSFTAFRLQQVMRRHSYERTARLLAGISLDGRDEEFRRIVGYYLSNEQYNLYVVNRDAANLYYDDPVKYREYIAQHELKGEDTWQWNDIESILRYRAQRKDTQRAKLRANTALACAIVNRLISALHAARFAGQSHTEESQPRSWKLEAIPSSPQDPTAYRVGLSRRF